MKPPKVGMRYEDARKQIKKSTHWDSNPYIRESLYRQAKLCEGDGAAIELFKEVNHDTNNHSSNKIGYSPTYEESWERIFGRKS